MLSMYSVGAEREWRMDRTRLSHERWIRKIWWSTDRKWFMIFACTIAEAREFKYCEHLQVDMSFKMIQGETNIWSFVGWSHRAKRMFILCSAYAKTNLIPVILPYIHVFTNLNSRRGYRIMWGEAFKILEDVSGETVRFSYMTRPETRWGLKTIGLDMCGKQAGGKHILSIC